MTLLGRTVSDFEIDTPTELLEDTKIEASVVGVSEFTDSEIEIRLAFASKATAEAATVFLKALLI